MKIQLKDIYYTDPEFYIKKGDIYISKGTITGINKKPEGFIPDRILNGRNKLLIPGLVNCHTHSYMSLFRNAADDIPFGSWLKYFIYPAEKKLTHQDAYWGALLSCIEMVKSGTTAFLDMHMFRHSSAKAVSEAGMRAVISRGLEGSGGNDSKRIREAFEEYTQWRAEPRLKFMLAPRSIETCDEKYLSTVLDVSRELGLGIHIHLAETAAEFDSVKKEHSMTPVEYLQSRGIFTRPTVAAHCVHVTDEDMDILKENNVNIAVTATSNIKSGNGAAPLAKMLEKDINVCIGTDGAASNNSLNMFSEMKMLAFINKAIERDPEAVSAFDVFAAATSGGAKALGLKCGVIAMGRPADLVVIDIDKPQFYPRNNLIAALVYSANGSEAETVIVDGKIILENGHMVSVDEERVYREAELIARRLM